MDDNIVIYPSQFNQDTQVVVIFPGHEKYLDFEPLFNELGFGFVAPEQNMVFIDGGILGDEDDLDIDILRFIEAHELAHVMLGHKERRPEDEKDADLYAFLLLNEKGYSQAKQYLVDTFFERHGEPFDITMIDKFK
jgi:hypothetical protein